MRWINAALLALSVGALTQVPAMTRGEVSYPPIDPSQFVTPSDLSTAASSNLTLMQGQIQVAMATTDAGGAFAGTWATPFTSPPLGYLADIPSAAATPYKCTVQTATATSFTGRCWQLVATTLPASATALLGLTISPVQNAAAGLSVRVVGRQ